MIEWPGSAVFVVSDGSEGPLGFVAGVERTGAFYRHFLRTRWFRAGMTLLPRVIRPSFIDGGGAVATRKGMGRSARGGISGGPRRSGREVGASRRRSGQWWRDRRLRDDGVRRRTSNRGTSG
jgi:hypothetical protein